jgi:hypothetical protein
VGLAPEADADHAVGADRSRHLVHRALAATPDAVDQDDDVERRGGPCKLERRPERESAVVVRARQDITRTARRPVDLARMS